MRTIFIAATVSILLSACATYEPIIPQGYTGPTAEISDDFLWETSSKNQLFYVDSVNGKPIESAMILTRQATAGQGFSVSAKTPTHKIPAIPLKLKLVATHVTGAPIHEITSRAAGTFFSVEGEVNFNPVADGHYRVAGSLKKGSSSVWIIDAKTKERVSDIVSEANTEK
jgi:hypothetical protein